MCEYRRLPNRKAVDIQGFDLRMPEGAHHFVVWAYGGDTQDDSRFPQGPVESVGCTGVLSDELAPQVLIPIQNPNPSVFLAQHRREARALRPGDHRRDVLHPRLLHSPRRGRARAERPVLVVEERDALSLRARGGRVTRRR